MAQNKHAPRECRIVKSEEYVGYGFNLYQEKSKPGQYIGRIEPGSPADEAGLKENDRLVEVNGVNIGGENHKQVVARIKSKMLETVLLVSDSYADNYHKERGVIIKSSLPYVVKLSNADNDMDEKDKDDIDSQHHEEEEIIDTRLQKVSFSSEEDKNDKNSVKRDSTISSDSKSDKRSIDLGRQDSGVSEESLDSIVSTPTSNRPDSNNENNDISDLGLNLSVEEVKERIRRRRKHDPRTIPNKRASGEWWNQYKMIQTL